MSSSTEVAVATPHQGGSTLVIDPSQNFWTPQQERALQQLGVKDAAPADLAVFFHQALRTGLDPFAKQIYMIGRKSKENNQWVTKQTIQTGIDGFRLIARRAADRAGETLAYEDTQWCGRDGIWHDVWLADGPPAAARVTVLRNGQRFPATVHWVEYVQTYTKDGKTLPTGMWERMGRNQLAKCAESQALRRAFPQDLSGLYIDEEMMAPRDLSHQQQRPAPQPRVTAAQIISGHVEAAPTPEAAEVAEVPEVTIDEEPPPEDPPPAADASEPQMSAPQRRKMMALFSEKGLRESAVRHAFVEKAVGVKVENSTHITVDQAVRVIDALEKLATPAAEEVPTDVPSDSPAGQ